MARIAIVDHSYHRKTRSSEFFSLLLNDSGHQVDLFWDESWKGGETVKFDEVSGYDVIIMFQSVCETGSVNFRSLHPNVIYIPMLDGFDLPRGPHWNLAQYWERFQGSKILSFSRALHGMAIGAGLFSLNLQFWPEPPSKISVPKKGLHGFFWLRRQDMVPWTTVRTLIGNTEFESFHLHFAPDPQAPKSIVPSSRELKKFGITMSKWFPSKDDFYKQLLKANVYFAPRDAEGIGQGFLEAMANGQCVVAPDQATMNEYIANGINGLLYDNKKPKPLDFSSANAIAKCARSSAVAGHSYWVTQSKILEQFIVVPSDELYRGKYRHRVLDGSSSPKFRGGDRFRKFMRWIG